MPFKLFAAALGGLVFFCLLPGTAFASGPDLTYSKQQDLYPSFAGVVYEFQDGALAGKRGYLFAVENLSSAPITVKTVPGRFKKNTDRYVSAGASYPTSGEPAIEGDPERFSLLFQDGDEVFLPAPAGEAAPTGNIVVIAEADEDSFEFQLRGRKALATYADAVKTPIFLEAPDPLDPLILLANAERSVGTPSTQFNLSADVLRSEAGAAGTIEWTVSDGRVFTGPTATLTFAQPGGYQVTARVSDDAGNTAESSLGILVYDAAGNVPGLNLPVPDGDLDADGRLSLKDAVFAAQGAARLRDLNRATRQRVDLDADGDLDRADADLIALALAQGGTMPSALLKTEGAPGRLVTMVSPALLDMAAGFTVTVGSAPAQPLSRALPGYGNFVVPDGLGGAGAVDVVLYRNGVEAERFAFDIAPSVSAPADPVAEVRRVFETIEALAAAQETALAEQLTISNVPARETELLLAASQGGTAELILALDELRRLLEAPGNERLAAVWLEIAKANGLDDFMATADAILATGAGGSLTAQVSPDFVCDVALPSFCALKAANDALSTGNDLVSAACDLLVLAAVGVTIFPVDGPAGDVALWGGWAVACAQVEAKLAVIGVVGEIVGSVDADLRLDFSQTSADSQTPVRIDTLLEFLGTDDLCVYGTAQGTDAVKDLLSERVVNRVIRTSTAARAIQKLFTFGGEDLLQRFFETIQNVTGEVLDQTQIPDLLGEFAGFFCDDLGGAPAPIEAARFLEGPTPDIGTITYSTDGSAEYTCPEMLPDGSDGVAAFVLRKSVCGEQKTEEGSVTCDEVLKPVTITIGDNGNLNDDIYEVQIDGQTVLTSSTPVRSISTTVMLPVGQTTVTMLGRAAPDGIGTYFISFSGATVLSGQTSGTDLVPGTSKTFLIDVQ